MAEADRLRNAEAGEAAVGKVDRRRTDTRERILDSAEYLLAEHGYDQVSVRDITGHAGVNLALVTYHFGSKERLLELALHRRAEVLNRDRQEALRAAMARPEPTVPDVMSAFVEPFLRRSWGTHEGWRNYCRLITTISPTGRWHHLMAKLFDDNARIFIEALMEVTRSANKEAATRAFLFCVGTMMSSIQGDQRFRRLTKKGPTDHKELLAQQVAFVSGGVTAMLIRLEKPRTRKPRKKGASEKK